MARTQIASKEILEDLSGVKITFTDGRVLELKLSELSDEIITRLALHGASQKLGDSYSGESDVAVAYTKADGVKGRLVEGDWRAVREGGAGRISDLAQALANLTGKSIEEAVEKISGMEKAEKTALRKHAQIRAELARITAERAAAAAAKAEDETPLDFAAL